MAAQQNSVGEDDRIVNDAIVGDMNTAHDEAIVSDPGGVFDPGMDGTMYGGGFADGHIVANDQMTNIAVGFEMLRRQSHKCCRPDFAAFADGRGTAQMRVFVDDRSGTDPDGSLDDAVRSDRDIVCKFCPGVD